MKKMVKKIPVDSVRVDLNDKRMTQKLKILTQQRMKSKTSEFNEAIMFILIRKEKKESNCK